jgi:hypothetical protein
MGGLERSPIPPAWRDVTELSYPFELPDARRVSMNYPMGWFSLHHIPVLEERAQTDTYLACLILADALQSLHGDFNRDLLLERVETQLDHRLVNGYYRHLGLAPGQRFASKGGYVVRFAEPAGIRLLPVSGWIVPDG